MIKKTATGNSYEMQLKTKKEISTHDIRIEKHDMVKLLKYRL